MKKIIYIYPQKSSFINDDIAFLSKHYEVKTQDLEWNNAKKLVLNWFLQKLFLLKNIRNSKAIIISFAGYFSLIPVVFGKVFGVKTLLILNGTDCVSFPEYHYGSLRKPLLKFFIKYSQKWATKLLPVDSSLLYQEHSFDETITIKKQGVKAFFPNIKTPFSVIPNGFDTQFWNFKNTSERQDFITVVSTSNKSTAIFKGVDLILEIAKKHPNQQFTIVGISEELQQQFDKTDNVLFYSFVQKEVLRELYCKHQFYMQLSVNEGFGCALSEAMLCGCIPVVANSGALPNVAGKSAFIVHHRTVENVEKMVKKVLNLSKEEKEMLSNDSRKHILTNFGIEKREELFLEEIKP
ncbi:MAG: glycosyltransferase family 4 protein [Flavobacteriaceae bacterium]|nr:glycosyltransferase family 4 protein [Flavobacteriaceae bacterium]